jgi:hypothetical protein
MLWLLFLPFRLALGIIALPFVLILLPFALLLWLPFAILRASLRLVVGLVVLPIVLTALALGLLVAGVGVALAVVVPLLPVLVFVFCIWAVVRLSAGPARSCRGFEA